MDHQTQLVEQVFFLAKDFKSGKQEFYEISQQDIFKVAPYIRNANASNILLDNLYAVVDKIIDKLSNPPPTPSHTPSQTPSVEVKDEPSNDTELSDKTTTISSPCNEEVSLQPKDEPDSSMLQDVTPDMPPKSEPPDMVPKTEPSSIFPKNELPDLFPKSNVNNTFSDMVPKSEPSSIFPKNELPDLFPKSNPSNTFSKNELSNIFHKNDHNTMFPKSESTDIFSKSEPIGMFPKLEPPSMPSMLSNLTNVPRPFADINSSYLHQQSANPYESMNFQNQYMGGPINNNLSHHGYPPKPPMFDPNSFMNGFPHNNNNNQPPGYYNPYNPMMQNNFMNHHQGDFNNQMNYPFNNPGAFNNFGSGNNMPYMPQPPNQNIGKPNMGPNPNGEDKLDESDHEDGESDDEEDDEDSKNRSQMGNESFANAGKTYAIDPKLIPGLGPTRRTRTKDKYRVVYSDHQRLELEKEFHYSRYITIRRKSELAQGLSLTERQVKIWFQNRRAKERKHMKKRDELMQKEKLDVAASFHAGQLAAGAAAHMNTIAAFNAGMPPMHLAHPGVMSAAAAASSAAALSHL